MLRSTQHQDFLDSCDESRLLLLSFLSDLSEDSKKKLKGYLAENARHNQWTGRSLNDLKNSDGNYFIPSEATKQLLAMLVKRIQIVVNTNRAQMEDGSDYLRKNILEDNACEQAVDAIFNHVYCTLFNEKGDIHSSIYATLNIDNALTTLIENGITQLGLKRELFTSYVANFIASSGLDNCDDDLVKYAYSELLNARLKKMRYVDELSPYENNVKRIVYDEKTKEKIKKEAADGMIQNTGFVEVLMDTDFTIAPFNYAEEGVQPIDAVRRDFFERQSLLNGIGNLGIYEKKLGKPKDECTAQDLENYFNTLPDTSFIKQSVKIATIINLRDYKTEFERAHTNRMLESHLMNELGESAATQFISSYSQNCSGWPIALLNCGLLNDQLLFDINQVNTVNVTERNGIAVLEVIASSIKVRPRRADNIEDLGDGGISLPANLHAILTYSKDKGCFSVDEITVDNEAFYNMFLGRTVSDLEVLEPYLDNNSVLEFIANTYIHSALQGLSETVKKSPHEMFRMLGEEIISLVKEEMADRDKNNAHYARKLVDLSRVLDATNLLIRNPSDSKAHKAVFESAKQVVKYKRGKQIAGMLMALAGAAVMAVSVSVAVISFGVASPLSIGALSLGYSLIAGGIAVAASATGLGFVIGGAVGAQTFFGSRKKANLVKQVDKLEDIAKDFTPAAPAA